jgi:hypothetical protein
VVVPAVEQHGETPKEVVEMGEGDSGDPKTGVVTDDQRRAITPRMPRIWFLSYACMVVGFVLAVVLFVTGYWGWGIFLALAGFLSGWGLRIAAYRYR